MKHILNHITTNLPQGSDIAQMLVANPDNYGGMVKELQEGLTLSQFAEFIDILLTQVKIIPLENQEPLKATKYSEAFREAGAEDLATAMAKFELIARKQFEKDFNFLNEEFIPYLKSLYEVNKAKFDQSLQNGIAPGPEQQMMLMLQGKFDWVAAQLKSKLETKKVAAINELRKNTEIQTLLSALTS